MALSGMLSIRDMRNCFRCTHAVACLCLRAYRICSKADSDSKDRHIFRPYLNVRMWVFLLGLISSLPLNTNSWIVQRFSTSIATAAKCQAPATTSCHVARRLDCLPPLCQEAVFKRSMVADGEIAMRVSSRAVTVDISRLVLYGPIGLVAKPPRTHRSRDAFNLCKKSSSFKIRFWQV